MAFTLHNKLSGKGNFVFDGFPIDRMPESCILPMPVVLEERIGGKMGLFLIDKTPFIHTLAACRPFNLMLRTGLLETSQGPVMFLLFYVQDSAGGSEPSIAFEFFLDPMNRTAVQPWRDLSRQTHWHLILVNGEGEEVDFLEFENIYGLGDALDKALKACEEMDRGDFALAKAEIYRDYTLDDLLGRS